MADCRFARGVDGYRLERFKTCDGSCVDNHTSLTSVVPAHVLHAELGTSDYGILKKKTKYLQVT
jgi:hypothetical protein